MALTNFPNGVSSFGIPVVPQGINPYGNVWFVDGNGNAGSGTSPEDSFATMAAAFAAVGSGDTIFMKGNIREELETPEGIFDVTIIGCGNQPRHADAHTGNNGYSAATWKTPASPTAATPLLIIQQQGWKISGILFDGPSDAAAIQIFRDGGSGDDERDGSHAWLTGNKFVAAQNHIELKGGPSQVVIDNNLLFGATAASLLYTVGAGIGTNNYHRITNNVFMQNASHIVLTLAYGTVAGNTIGRFTTAGIDLRSGEYNAVWMNQLSGTYSNVGGYYAGSNDEWGGNFNSLAGGVTASDPA
jgi:hypothetical protein